MQPGAAVATGSAAAPSNAAVASAPEYKEGEVMLQWRNLGLKVFIKEKQQERVILHNVTGEVVRLPLDWHACVSYVG